VMPSALPPPVSFICSSCGLFPSLLWIPVMRPVSGLLVFLSVSTPRPPREQLLAAVVVAPGSGGVLVVPLPSSFHPESGSSRRRFVRCPNGCCFSPAPGVVPVVPGVVLSPSFLLFLAWRWRSSSSSSLPSFKKFKIQLCEI
jgi:hypothetical protein